MLDHLHHHVTDLPIDKLLRTGPMQGNIPQRPHNLLEGRHLRRPPQVPAHDLQQQSHNPIPIEHLLGLLIGVAQVGQQGTPGLDYRLYSAELRVGAHETQHLCPAGGDIQRDVVLGVDQRGQGVGVVGDNFEVG